MIRLRASIELGAAWILAAGLAFFLVGYISQPEANPIQILLLTLAFSVVVGLVVFPLAPKAADLLSKETWLQHWPLLAAVALLGRFLYRVVGLSLSMPNLLQAQTFLLPGEQWASFAAGALLGLAGLWLATQTNHRWQTGIERMAEFCKRNWRGLLLGAIFFAVYLVLANVFNRLDFNNNNVFFAADSHQWRLRMSDPIGPGMEMRAVHPLGYFLVRPPVWLLEILLGAAPFQANMLVLALIGGLEIGLAWLLLRRLTGSGDHAFLFAALMGISTSYLMFNSLTETYIFSGFLLVLFFVLLQARAHWGWLAATGVGVFGIAITNLAQAAIGLLLARNLKRTLLVVAVILVAAAGLNLVHSQIYSDSALFFVPSKIEAESQHFHTGSTPEEWQARASLVSKDVLLFSVVAPEPYVFEYDKDVRGPFPKFNMMLGPKATTYVGLGRYFVWLWAGLLVTSVGFFIRALRQRPITEATRFGLIFLGCVLFNLVFHFLIGFEPFLYSADWTYALVLFAALGFSRVAESKWVQAAALILLATLTLNNLSFLSFLMRGIAPYIGG